MKFNRPIHNEIWGVLLKFNASYLSNNGILFGGSTLINLELSEYRESVDIDFLCSNPTSYKAVRSQITSNSFGALLNTDENITLCREIRADRDAVRSVIQSKTRPIKLEFIHFDYYELDKTYPHTLFPVPYIDQTSCFLTKLLANADRYSTHDKKNIFDLCVMFHEWGRIPEAAWIKADLQYETRVVMSRLERALTEIIREKENLIHFATNTLAIALDLARVIIEDYAPNLLNSVQRNR